MPLQVGRLKIQHPINEMIAKKKFRERNAYVLQVSHLSNKTFFQTIVFEFLILNDKQPYNYLTKTKNTRISTKERRVNK